MQNIFNVMKGKALGVAEYLTPVLKESKFLETGVITPEEFVAAGDHLTFHCPSWRWEAGDSALARPYLPQDKQFLVTRNVPCLRRVNQLDCDMKESIVEAGDGDDGWVNTQSDLLDHASEAREMTLCETSEIKSNTRSEVEEYTCDDDAEPLDMDEFDRLGLQADDPAEYVADLAPGASYSAHSSAAAEIILTRSYDLHITYDKYYQTPRLWLTGYSETRQPLTVDEMYEDFSEDHANKTITIEAHPHLSAQNMASVHPCKHAETMKRLCETVAEGGGRLEVYMYLIVFLKFMQAIIPTVEYDFTHKFSL